MKKLIPILLALLMLCSCTVGPMEEAREPLVTPDASVPDNTLPAAPDPEPEPTSDLPEDETVPPDDTVSDDGASDGNDDNTDDESGDEVIEIEDSEFAFLYATISLNVRSGPSTDYEAIGFLNEGEEVEVLGYAGDYGWYLIKYRYGEGFVSGNYMTPDAPSSVRNDDDGDEAYDAEYPDAVLGMENLDAITRDYAAYKNIRYENVWLRFYYGTYLGGDAVVLSVIGEAETDDENHFSVGGSDFYLPSGSLRIYIHTPSGNFVELSQAYENQLVSANDVAAISFFNSTVAELPMPSSGDMGACEYPELDPLDNAIKATIAADYDKAYNLVSGTAYVVAYYGTYNGSHAVVMWQYDQSLLPNEHIGLPKTEDISEFTVYGRRFILMSGSYSIKIHTPDGRFLTLKDAISQGVIKESDLDMMSYYNLNGSR